LFYFFECRLLGQEVDWRAPCVPAIAASGIHYIDALREHVGNRDRTGFGLGGHCSSGIEGRCPSPGRATADLSHPQEKGTSDRKKAGRDDDRCDDEVSTHGRRDRFRRVMAARIVIGGTE